MSEFPHSTSEKAHSLAHLILESLHKDILPTHVSVHKNQ